jgi:hypothetical protein
MAILVMPQILESWQLCHNMFSGWQMGYFQNFWIFLIKFGWSLSPSKLEAPYEVKFGRFPFFMEHATCALIFFSSKSIRSNCAQLLPCPKGRKPHQIGHHMWKILALVFGQLMGLPPKQAMPNKQKFLHPWSEVFTGYLWPTWCWALPCTSRSFPPT